MPLSETHKLFLTFLMELNYEEEKVNELRKNLFFQPNFNPYIIFKRFDIDDKNLITIENLMKFLEVNIIKYNLNEIKTILNFYDADNLNGLNYSNFLNLIIPNNELYEINEDKREEFPLKYLPYPIEYSVCRIFEKELYLVRKTNQLKEEIKKRKDFSILGLFLTIRNNNEKIDIDVLKDFIKKNGINCNYEDIKRIMKRLNICKSGYITIDDLQKIFEINKVTSSNKVYNDRIINDLIRNQQQINLNNIRKDKNNNSTFEISDNLNNIDSSFQNSNNNNDNNLQFQNNNQGNNLYKKNSVFHNTELSNDENYNLCINLLMLICETEISIENQKIELSLREDFNIKDAYNFFCVSKNNYISNYDLKISLNNLGLYPNNDEINLLLKKYDICNNGIINFIDFFDMLVPFNKEYRNKMEKKNQLSYSNKSIIFNERTFYFLKNFFLYLIESEKKIENIRQKLYKRKTDCVMKLFNEFDKILRGVFSISDYYQFFNEKFGDIPKGIDLSFIRFDRKREGQIDWLSFVYEFIPKLNVN